MRELERIDRILEQVKTEWIKNQDNRFFQLLYKLQFDYANENNGRGKVDNGNGQVGYDNFYLEDADLEEFLKK
jgi:hypothetical protein